MMNSMLNIILILFIFYKTGELLENIKNIKKGDDEQYGLDNMGNVGKVKGR